MKKCIIEEVGFFLTVLRFGNEINRVDKENGQFTCVVRALMACLVLGV